MGLPEISAVGRTKYRIAHVITRLELGGAQQNTLHCVAEHDRERFEAVLVAGAGGVLDADARAIPGARVHLVPWLKHPISPASDLAGLGRLGRLLREERIDLVHTHSSKAGILGRFAARRSGARAVVHTVHGWSFNDMQPAPLRRLYVALERAAARRTDRLVTVSRRDRDRGIALGIGTPERYRVLHSGIDPDRYRRPRGLRETVRRRLGYAPEDVVVGTLACLKPQKAPLDVVRAAAEARGSEPRLKFFIAGDGDLRPEVERLAVELGLGDAFRLLGWRRDVPDLLQAMDVFLLTSRFEGLPRAVLQAMAAGVAVVATAVDGTPEVVEDGVTGLLVPPGRPEAAAAAVVRLARDDALRHRCREAAQGRIDDAFDIRRMVRDLDALYLELLEGGHSSRD